MIRAFSILALACLLVLGACGDSSNDEPSVQIQDLRLVEMPSGERQVMGTLRNPSSKDIGNAQVQVSLFDEDNVQIETMNIIVRDIPASGEVDFKQALNTGADVQGARVKNVLVM